MTPILERERALYENLWSAVPAYGDVAPGERYLPMLLEIVGARRGTVLDAGTGSGKGAIALAQAGFRVTLCDVTDQGLTAEARRIGPFHHACLWHDLRPLTPWSGAGKLAFDDVYCTDVLEHVPPQFTMLAIDQLLRVARHGVFLAVALVPDLFGAWVGQALHQTVEGFTWWRDALRELGDVTEARDLQTSAVFYVRPR